MISARVITGQLPCKVIQICGAAVCLFGCVVGPGKYAGLEHIVPPACPYSVAVKFSNARARLWHHSSEKAALEKPTLILPELSADSVGLEASPGASSLDLEPQETKDSIMTVARSVARAFFRDISFSSLKIMNMFFYQEHDVRTPS